VKQNCYCLERLATRTIQQTISGLVWNEAQAHLYFWFCCKSVLKAFSYKVILFKGMGPQEYLHDNKHFNDRDGLYY
jgi:hypothetical protein